MRALPLAALLVAGCAGQMRPDPAFDAAFAEAVSVCEVRANPEAYLEKTILMRGRYTHNHHGSGLWLEECRSAWTDLRGSEGQSEDPEAARILTRLEGDDRNRPNEVVYRGVLRREPAATVNGVVVDWHYRFHTERLVAAKPG